MNKLVAFLNKQRGGQSIRKFAKTLGFSHSFVAGVLKEQRPVTYAFAVRVANVYKLTFKETFLMAGLLDKETANEVEVTPSAVGESHTSSVPQKVDFVTTGEVG